MSAAEDGKAAAPASEMRLAILTASVYATIGIHLPFFAIWLGSRGLSSPDIAALFAVPPLVRLIANLIIPPQADRSGDIPGMLTLCALATAIAYAAMGFIDGFWPILAAVVALAFAQGPVIPLADALILNEVRRRADAGSALLDYARVRGWGSVAVLVMMVAGAQVVALVPREAIVWLLAGLALITAGVAGQSARRLPRPAGSAIAPPAAARPLPRPMLVALFAIAASLIQASHSLLYTFASLQWRAEGLGDGFIGLLWAAGVATETVFYFILGPRLGETRALGLLAAGGIVAILRWLVMAAGPPMAALLPTQMLHGATYGATQLGAVYLLSGLAGPSRRAQAQGWLSAAAALSMAGTTLACGFLQAEFGRQAYLFMAAVALAGLLLAAFGGVLLSARPPHPQSSASGG